ncbi:MAG: YfhO family protein [Bacteroidetes bacterium]|nr:YfhO family protein [Bacteroidota bacterium]
MKPGQKTLKTPASEKQSPAGLPVLNTGIDIHFWLALAFIVIVPIVFMFPLVFEGKTFSASDTQQWMGTAKVLMDYVKSTGEMALWNSNMFGGMPGYMVSLPNPIPGFDSWGLSLIAKILDWRVVYLIFMGIGAFLYSRIFTKNSYLGAFAAVAFMLSTYFIIILKVGHNTKFQAIAFIPWMFLSFHYLIKTVDWKAAVAFALALSLQLRAGHPQITYYTLIALGIFGLFWLADLIAKKEWKPLYTGTGLIIAAFILGALSIAFPYLINYEYSTFTIRGGTIASGTSGLSTDYALSWSYDWVESVSFFVADFFGGHSPFYWWQMPFTEGPQYLGAILLLLASLTFINKIDRVVLSLWAVSLVVWLFSMGSNFQILADFLLNYFPMFNKFRTPSMILVVLSITLPILAVLGVKGFIDGISDKKTVDAYLKKVYIVFGGILAFGIVLLIATGSMSFLKPSDASQYDAQTLDYLKNERSSLAVSSVWKFLIFNLIAMGLLLLTAWGKIKEAFLGFGLLILVTIDLYSYSHQYLSDLKPKKTYEATFNQTQLDNFLLSDKSDYRILPVGNLFQSTRFNYYHQSIGGYHGAKLSNFQNLFDQCLYKGSDPQLPFNWGILQSFGIKYLIIPQPVNQAIGPLLPSYIDQETKESAMEFSGFHGKYFFVEKVETVPDLKEKIEKLNIPGWDPKKVSFVNKELSGPIGFDSSSTVKEIKFDLHEIELEVTTATTGFLFLSEIYYPAGWKAYIDGQESEIFETNVAFRGLVIPSGTYKITMEFKPASVSQAVWMSSTGTFLLYGLSLTALFVVIRNRKNA